MNPGVNAVGPGYFATLGQPLVAGREFTVKDVDGAPRVAIINETMAQYFFGKDSPLGRHYRLGHATRPRTSRSSASRATRRRRIAARARRRRASSTRRTCRSDEIGEITFYVRAARRRRGRSARRCARRAARRSATCRSST